jgi:cysteine desulfurase
MLLPIYLDYAATTPVDPRVIEQMVACLGKEGSFGNPASNTHIYGYQAKEKIEQAREQVAALINGEPREIIWTSGATESNNLAIQGAALANQHRGKHIITCKTEHKAVLDVCAFLETQGFEITYLPVQSNGLIDFELLKNAIRTDTILMSIMHVNNEIGVIQDIAAICQLAHQHNIIVHVDAAQSIGKIPVDVKALDVDLLSISAHKLYGPKGAGALYVRHRPKIRLQPLIYGGGQERGLRSGTLATHQIVGFGAACEIALREMTVEAARIKTLKNQLWQGISVLPQIQRKGDPVHSVPGILSVSFAGVDGEALLMALQLLAVSSGSACTSATMKISHVLQALGMPPTLAQATIRFSVGRFTTEHEMNQVVEQVIFHVNKLRQLSPLWKA